MRVLVNAHSRSGSNCLVEIPARRSTFHLDPANVRMRSATTYGALPNVDELNTVFGDDRTGHLDST